MLFLVRSYRRFPLQWSVTLLEWVHSKVKAKALYGISLCRPSIFWRFGHATRRSSFTYGLIPN